MDAIARQHLREDIASCFNHGLDEEETLNHLRVIVANTDVILDVELLAVIRDLMTDYKPKDE
jgi:siroheme synthase (precorrin-2 oxidase/ferrochelatase)